MSTMERTVGDVLRDWRQRRHFSQLDLANEAGVSSRHLSFLETGRSRPSREILLRLADHLDVPPRERNALLLAGGFAPVYPERPLQDPALGPAREAVDLILSGHEPYPALAIDRHWTLLSVNRSVPVLLEGVADHLLRPPVNVMRLCFHPDGIAPRIVNAASLRSHLAARLHCEIGISGDRVLQELLSEISGYPLIDDESALRTPGFDVAVPFVLRTEDGVLSFISTTTVFGTAIDVTLNELAIESFFPADAETGEILRRLAEREP
ncbi:MAG: helix-turn-helix transcriptional regulator [Chloroflexia bacterium]|nr:helix-turn-helix transcriptional regulator [Chloroflexia bacterium]